MAEPTIQEQAQQFTELGALEQGLLEGDNAFDRAPFEESTAEYLLDRWVMFEPSERANMYINWKMTADEVGLAGMQDYEIVLMSFAARDSKAKDAVADGEVVLEDLNWYEENITYDNMSPDQMVAWSQQQNKQQTGVFQLDWTQSLIPEQRERVSELTSQGLNIYEPNPSREFGDHISTAVTRTTIGTAAVLTAWITGIGAVGAVGALATTPAATTLATAAGGGIAVAQRIASSAYRPIRALQSAFQQGNIVRSGGDLVPYATRLQRSNDFFGLLSQRTGKATTDLIVNAAARIPGNSQFLGRTANVIGGGAGRTVATLTGGPTRASLLVAASASLGFGTWRSYAHEEEVQAHQDGSSQSAKAGTDDDLTRNPPPELMPWKTGVSMTQGVTEYANLLETALAATDAAVNESQVRLAQADYAQQFGVSHSVNPADIGEGTLPDPIGITAEQDDSILTGDMLVSEILTRSTAEEFSAQAMADFGGRYLGSEEDELAATEGGAYIVFEDQNSDDGMGNPRKFLLPASSFHDQASNTVDPVFYAWQNSRALKVEAEEEGFDENPFIGVDANYRALVFDKYGDNPVFDPVRRTWSSAGTDRGGIRASEEIARLRGPDYELAKTGVEGTYRTGFRDPLETFGADSAPRPSPGQMDRFEAGFVGRMQGLPGFEEESREVAPQYRESDVWDQMANMSPSQIFRFQGLMRTAGAYQSNVVPIPGQFTQTEQALIGSVMWEANVNGTNFWNAADNRAKAGLQRDKEERENRAPASSPSKAPRAPFSVPAQLRSIPGEKTVAEEVKARFERKLGRQATAEELSGIAEELTGYHITSNQEQIALYLAAYEGDNQGLLTGADMQRIEDPGAATSFDIADKWANEIDLNKRRETNSQSFSRMLSATMGNRPSVGNLTPAGGVTEIGRN